MGRGGPKGKTWLGVWKTLDLPTRREVALAALEQPYLMKALLVAVARHDRVRRQSVERWEPEITRAFRDGGTIRVDAPTAQNDPAPEASPVQSSPGGATPSEPEGATPSPGAGQTADPPASPG